MFKKLKQYPFAALLLIILFDQTSISMMYPLLTLIFFDPASHLLPIETSLGTRNLWYGMASAITYIVSFSAAPLLGALSDYLGRKYILFICACSALILAISHTLAILLGSVTLLLIGRIFSGLCARTEPVAQAVVGDISLPHNKLRNMGYLQFIISIGAFIGPILGGLLAQSYGFQFLNFSLPFLVSAICALGGIWLTSKTFKETWQPQERIKAFKIKPWLALLRDKNILAISLCLLLIQLSWSIYYQFIPPLLSTLFHFSASQIGLYIGLIAFWLALASLFGIRWLQAWLTPAQMIHYCTYAILIGLLLAVLAVYCTALKSLAWLAAIPIAAGDVIAYSAMITLYSNYAEQSAQGKIMGLCFLIVSLAWASTGLLGGLLNKCYPTLAITLAPLGVLLLIILRIKKQHIFDFKLIAAARQTSSPGKEIVE